MITFVNDKTEIKKAIWEAYDVAALNGMHSVVIVKGQDDDFGGGYYIHYSQFSEQYDANEYIKMKVKQFEELKYHAPVSIYLNGRLEYSL